MNFDRLHPFISKIKERKLLTGVGSTKETYHISLDLQGSGIQFKPGDSIGIYAQNDPILVQHLIEAMKASGEEPIIEQRSLQPMTLRYFLTHKANLARLTSSFLKLFHEYERAHDKKNQLSRLLNGENKALLTQYLAAHDPLDLCKEYGETTVPLQELCNQFGPLLPRFYSVASSQTSYPNEVHLTVALFTFTHAEEKRFGVASHFLTHIAHEQETPIPLYVQIAHSFALPSALDADLIMIGPGTGVAPYRAFLQERLSRNATGRHWLFFGERNRATDYLYGDYWDSLEREGQLVLDLAFSRDQFDKIYVQHKMYAKAEELWNWIKSGAYIYVCGDAQHMAKDVEATLIQIAIEQGYLNTEEAKAFFKSLRTQKRYLLDVY
jgi:sulfite reductase (NADPH) flavoprotein alpha-component